MKKLLLCLTALSMTFFTFSQVPVNDLIENAIEITTSNYNDNVNISEATDSSGGQTGCSTAGYKTVYYKFIATANGTVNAAFSGGDINQSFLIFFTAPNLNVTSESELSLAPGSLCSLALNANVSIVNGQSYYLLASQNGIATSSLTVTTALSVPNNERQALIDFYNATDGPNWAINTNWNTTAPVSQWAGVTVEDGHVVAMGLGNVGVTGQLPSAILNLPFLRSFNFSNNELTGVVPDLTVLTNLETFNISGNNFSFEDLEPNYTANSSLLSFSYANQKLINEELIIDNPVIGQEYIFNTTTLGTNLSYQWVKKGVEVFDPVITEIPGATSANYTIASLQEEDIVNYSCRVTSPIITDLTLERELIKLRIPVSQTERDALIALYNATDGANWVDNTNWLTSAHVDDWDGISTVGGKVIVINRNFQNLNGQLPNEIGNLIHLKELRISVNANLTGSIPATIGNLTELEWFRLQQNGMSGEIPASVSNLTKLTRVYLQNNQFSGNIPEGFGNAPDMYQIFLNDNQFEGQIPASLGGLNALVSFDVSNNNLSGTLPTELGNQSSILLFNIANNDFSGSLPDWSGITDPENAAFNLTNNYFDFSDLEPFVNNGVNYSSILYSPQRTLDQEDDIQTPPGVDIQLDIDDADINRNSDDTAMNNEYQWYKDNVAISGANANTYTIVNAQTTDSGIYFCEITNTTLPGLVIVRADINVLVDDNLSTTDFEYNNFKIYPNPVNNWLSIKTNTITHAKVQVFDVHGKLVIERPLTSEITALDVERLSSGMYLISVSTNDKQTTKRFIKQ
jgi:Leucine-rich repeat (LRR) protein